MRDTMLMPATAGVAVAAGGDVQQHTADAVQALAAEAGRTVEEDLPEVPGAAGDLGDAESADGLAPQEHGKQDAEADALAQGGGRACAAVPKPRPKMKTGSSTMLSTPPVTRPIMAKLALPS